MMIRKLTHEEINEGFCLIHRVYLKTEYINDGKKGYQTFKRRYIENSNLIASFYQGISIMYGYYDNNLLKGVISLDKNNYICFLFIEVEFQHQGIATKLLRYIERIVKRRKNKLITLDSSLYGLDFYLKFGFKEASQKIIEDDMVYIPLKKELK